ncbi:urease accessory protein UreE [Thermoleptolyngbya sp.]
MLVLTQRLSAGDRPESAEFTLLLTAEERGRSRHYFESVEGVPCSLQLTRGTVLRDGDLLVATSGERVRVVAKPEPVVTVTAPTPLALLRAAYHLGNRHVPLEIAATYLRFSPDPVLQDLVEKMGLYTQLEERPFQPETGAYDGAGNRGQDLGHSHSHSHSHSHGYSHSHSHVDSHSDSHSHSHDHSHCDSGDHSHKNSQKFGFIHESSHSSESSCQSSDLDSQNGSLHHSHKHVSKSSWEHSQEHSHGS